MASSAQLIKDHTPILWLHPDEAYIPEDCKVIAERGNLYKKGKKPRKVTKFKQTLDDLANYDSNYYLKLPEIDMREFMVSAEHGIPGSGPQAVAELVKKNYSNNPFSSQTIRHTPPKFYVRVSKVKLSPKIGTKLHEKGPEELLREYYGEYTVIQYFFFYLFNDFWNKHVGDWDSTIEVLINNETNEKYAIYSMHETNWFLKLGQSNEDIRKWLMEDWPNDKDKGKSIYTIGSHPFGFVAKGGHGVYPTPGYTIYGADLPFIDAICVATDERVIGHTCILPDDIDETDLQKLFATTKPKIDSSPLKVLKWSPYEILGKQRWLQYKGLWGEETTYKGWDGPEGPARPKWRINADSIKKKILLSLGGQNTGDIYKNWHGIQS